MHSFSVIVPTYNYADYVGHALDSLLSQDYLNMNIIVVDDGSTDHTAEVMRNYLQTFPTKIQYITQTNKGAGGARNTGSDQASGDYVLFLDADDRMLPSALTLLDQFLKLHPGIDAVFAGHLVVRGERQTERHHAPTVSTNHKQNFIKLLNKDFPAPTGSYVVKRDILKTIRFSEKITNYEDGVFLAHLVSRYNIASFDKPIVAIHRHSDSLRSRIEPNKHSADLICSILFDDTILPKAFFVYENLYKSSHLLRLFRRCILNKEFAAAKNYYHEAIRLRKMNLLQTRYLKKYIVLRLKMLLK